LADARNSQLSSISYGELAPYLRIFNVCKLSQGRIYSSNRGMTIYADVWAPEFRRKKITTKRQLTDSLKINQIK
jgi:hypothetical protein